jgi:alpha-glucosidase (family GH31 glycosyl hydrolase)
MIINLYFIRVILTISSLFVINNALNETVPRNQRIDCFPEPGVNEQGCRNRNCTYDTSGLDPNNPTVPLCYYPSLTGYAIESGTNPITLKKSPYSINNPYETDFDELTFTSKEIGAGLHITIAPKNMTRYRPVIPINDNPNLISSDKLVLNTQNDAIFSFQVQRQRTGANIWDTSIGGLLFSDRFLQIATLLPSDKIYGFGENVHQEIKHNFTRYTTWGMFTRDFEPDSLNFNTLNYYGAHPFYLGIEPDGSAHGVFIYNSNAQEVTTGPAPHLVYRTIGGQLEIFFFPGPTPEQVIQQYEAVIGKPYLPAYWALGFQLCRWAYKNVTDVQTVINRTINAGIPLDVVFVDTDYAIDNKDFTLNTTIWGDLPAYIDWLHANGMHMTPNVDIGIAVDYDSFARAMQQNASFISWPRDDMVPQDQENLYNLTKNTRVMLGNVWPTDNVAFPDFLDPTNITRDWWANEFALFHQILPFDGIWIDMNEPSNFDTGTYHPNTTSTTKTRAVRSAIGPEFKDTDNGHPLKCPISGPDSKWDNPPYGTINVYNWINVITHWGNITNAAAFLFNKTLCMVGATQRGNQRFYDTHSLTGWSEARATYNALKVARGKRGQVISRSTYVSSGRYGGHWLGDNTARWEDLRTSIIGAQEFNMFGIPHVGSDICGFYGVATEDLCLRWQQMGAFHSFSRNHHDGHGVSAYQDPGMWPSVAAAARKANLFRYRHLPYLFSLHFSASLKGGTVVRPVFFEFPADSITHTLSHQFLWGSALLIIPVIQPNATTVDGYLPSGAIWYSVYDYFYGSQVKSGQQTLTAPPDYLIPVFVRGGHILPRQRPSTTTVASRLNELQLLVALDTNNQASGELYWDDGESIVPNDDISQHNYYHFLYNFTVNQQSATLKITRNNTAMNLQLKTLDNIEIFGYQYQPTLSGATLNGKPVSINTLTSSYSPFTKVLNITTTGLIDLNNNGPVWTLSWPNVKSEKLE